MRSTQRCGHATVMADHYVTRLAYLGCESFGRWHTHTVAQQARGGSARSGAVRVSGYRVRYRAAGMSGTAGLTTPERAHSQVRTNGGRRRGRPAAGERFQSTNVAVHRAMIVSTV